VRKNGNVIGVAQTASPRGRIRTDEHPLIYFSARNRLLLSRLTICGRSMAFGRCASFLSTRFRISPIQQVSSIRSGPGAAPAERNQITPDHLRYAGGAAFSVVRGSSDYGYLIRLVISRRHGHLLGAARSRLEYMSKIPSSSRASHRSLAGSTASVGQFICTRGQDRAEHLHQCVSSTNVSPLLAGSVPGVAEVATVCGFVKAVSVTWILIAFLPYKFP